MDVVSAAVLLPVFIGVGWLLCRLTAEHHRRGLLLWAVASVIGIIVTAGSAARSFSAPMTDRDPLGSPPSFAILDGLMLGVSTALSILVFVVLLFLSGQPRAPESTDRFDETEPATDPLRRLGDAW